jgi:TPR repeat protein
MYLSGYGIEKDNAKAFYWFKRSAGKNNVLATRVMAETYRFGQMGQKVDLEQAKLWEDKLPRLEAMAKKAAVEKRAAIAAARKIVEEEKAAKKLM